MKKFIEEYLDIKDYKITYFDSGKNNITAKVEYNKGTFVIQKEGKAFLKAETQIINYCLPYFIKEKLSLAGNYFEDRFFEFEGDSYQVMECIEGITKGEDEIDIECIKNMSRYLAKFHNISEKIDYVKKEDDQIFKSNKMLLDKASRYSHKGNGKLFKKIKKLTKNIVVNKNLKKGIIHGDPAYKNFLFNNTNKITGLIDYEKIEYEVLLWDLVDFIRSLLKIESFDKNQFVVLLNEYEKIRPLNKQERYNLEGYLKLMILNTTTQYFLALYPESGCCNTIGDTYSKIERGFNELEKIDSFFHKNIVMNDWNNLKKNIELSSRNDFHIRPKEIWYIHMGKNIGYESFGKTDLFIRPVIVLKVIGNMFFVASMTTKIKNDKFSFKLNNSYFGVDSFISLTDIRTIDKKRFISNMGIINYKDYIEIQKKLKQLVF